MDITFQDRFQTGQIGESVIARWLKSRGYSILPVYDVEIDRGKGPQLFMPTQDLIAPDLFAFSNEKAYWIEAKHKTRFSWHGVSKNFVTGIDIRHYLDYCKVDDSTPWPVWLFFLHREKTTWFTDVQRWGAPLECPTGLFAGKLEKLRMECNHTSDRHGSIGMIYWRPFDHLTLLASLDDLSLFLLSKSN